MLSDEDLDFTHWNDDIYLRYLDNRAALNALIDSISLNELEKAPFRKRRALIERSIEQYRHKLNATAAQRT